MKALELGDISKSYGGRWANRGVSLSAQEGEIHGLVGENGAGKSTLMKIAYGEVRADSGTICLRGTPVPRQRHSPRRAIALGVGLVHQHFMLIERQTVVENVILGREPRRARAFLDLGRAAADVRRLGARVGLAVDPEARVEALSVGQKQRVEIIRVLGQQCAVLLLDEPTAVLTPAEVDELFAVLRQLAADGMTIVLVSHKLDEIEAICHRVTVMRQGQVVRELAAPKINSREIARAMVGRPVLLDLAKTPPRPAAVVLSVQDLWVTGDQGEEVLRGVSLSVRGGEIVGIAGVEGNGQTELVEALFGLRAVAQGTIALGDRDVSAATVRERARAGMALIPGDRLRRGLIGDFSLIDNLVLGQQRELATRWGLDRRRIRARGRALVDEFAIEPPELGIPARALSGGNQQKVVVARELGRPGRRLLLCAHPTRGIDIGAVDLIRRRILAARDRGLGVLLVSSDLDELCALADRLVVLYRGTITAELDQAELARSDIGGDLGAYMTGAARRSRAGDLP